MAYVTPNSTLQLFKGIRLDNRYMHTIYFANEAAQNTWFTAKVTQPLTFNNLMYRRYDATSVKIEVDATSLLGVTYMRFKNTRASSKWFYAFVLSIDYVNENTSIIYYEIDVMQTWFIQNGSIPPCMVLREHANDDTFGINLEEEPIGSSVYDMDFITKSDEFNQYAVVANVTGEPQDVYINGLFCGSKHLFIGCNNDGQAAVVKTELENLLGSWDEEQRSQNIIDLYTVPYWLYNQEQETHVINVTMPTPFDDYTPKNNKLYMYPYNYLMCTTHDGEIGTYRWEYFDGMQPSQTVQFKMYGTHIGGGQIICVPHDPYNGSVENWDAGVKMSNFPKNSFTFDAYQAWIASGGSSKYSENARLLELKGAAGAADMSATAINLVGDVVAGAAATVGAVAAGSFATGVPVITRAASKVITDYSSMLKQEIAYDEARNKVNYEFKDAMYKPNTVVGNDVPALAVGERELNFHFYSVHVRADEAKRIDDFFTVFGYTLKRVKTPNLTGRTYWNFVQTENCEVAGDMPASSRAAIAKIFDGGITFWHDGDNVGNYGQSVSYGTINNPIVT